MSRPRENKTLRVAEYDIAGNAIRAYYDASNKLIFVLDETINADKPNVMLVIDSFDERKWDDVLVNDYGVDLETVRPKRDNKYQKLDIEYGGLDVYMELISANETGDDLSNAIDNLIRFRAMSVRRAVTERLAAANDTIEKSHDTIERTNEAISDLRKRVKDLRARVSEYRRGIGREPTKASAAKILKAEAQLDAVNEKLTRAKKRLSNAQHRLANAEEDAEIARSILSRDVPKIVAKKSVSAPRKVQPVIIDPMVPVADADYDIEDDEDVIPEPKAEKMAEEVKPLFDKDPENLDDEMAFKPIDFGSTVPEDDQPIAPAPLSFTPPKQISEQYETVVDENVKPVLEGMSPVAPVEPELQAVPELPNMQDEPAPVAEEKLPEPEPFNPEEPELAPVAPITQVRPVSPITGNIAPAEQRQQKSTFMYYLMLILLILLSIGTLWLYQKSTNENIPDLAKPVAETSVAAQQESKPELAKKNEVSAFVVTPTVVKESISKEPVAVAIPEPVAAPVVEVEAVVATPEPVEVKEESVTVDVVAPEATDEEVSMVVPESPFIEPEPVITKIATYEPEPVRIPTEAEVIASKPGYNVSQNENMFVASPDYDTETIFTEDEDVPQCEGGSAPDGLGCCPGEEYTYTDDGFMCCSAIECFPPLK